MRLPTGRSKRRLALTCAFVVVAAIGAACSGGDPPSLLDPAGPGARRVEGLWWPMLWISVVVFAIVAAMLVYATLRRRREAGPLDRSEARWGDPFIAVAGVFIPFVILAGVFVLSLREMNGLSADAEGSRLTIQVIGHDWWWEARYPNGAVTANEIHIPVGEPVEVELTTADVIHSFWVPELQVKTDQIPGQTNRQWIEADEAGTYRGQCAEFCGLQHANMVFYVIADEDFDAWVSREAEPAVDSTSAGEELFMDSSCAGCHAIRGTAASETLGPDLTHVASRSTVAGVAEMNRDAMFRFVRDAQELKPGATMPPAELSDADVQAVVDYLMGLE